MPNKIIIDSLNESLYGIKKVLANKETLEKIEIASALLYETLNSGNKIFSCGNGGSMCDAMHFAEELSGRFREDRKPLAAISISDPSFLTCTANDFGYKSVFSRFVEANAVKNDLVLAITTSGNSENIIEVCKYCNLKGIKVISLTGKLNSPVSKISNCDICTPNGNYSDRVQELHGIIIHILVELVEKKLFA
tara:strand:+ start:54 stop:632 length:579 start_codon:yes stop_codon:yes gene_type:complete